MDGANSFLGNQVSTTKYSVFTFLPKFFYEQFSRYANLLFLFVACIQQVPDLSPTTRYATALPLFLVLLTSAVKELVEDKKRLHADRKVNNATVHVWNGGEFAVKKWRDLKVGEIVKIGEDEAFPADLLLLSATDSDGICYVETCNIDGETNLKLKQARQETNALLGDPALGSVSLKLTCEPPSNQIYSFEGTLELPDGLQTPLGPEQLLLRGATLRNTRFVVAVVVYTGHDTRILRNSHKTPIKGTFLDQKTNAQIVIMFLIVCLFSLLATIGSLLIQRGAIASRAYLGLQPLTIFTCIIRYFTFFALLHNFIPISLIVTMEMVRFQQAALIDADLKMYDHEKQQPASAQNSTLVAELGQVEYIFTDKTGTLTCNKMELRECIVGGRSFHFGQETSLAGGASSEDLAVLLRTNECPSKVRLLANTLGVCHTVIPQQNDEGHLEYQASSPDEIAIVKGAAAIGHRFTSRRSGAIVVNVMDEPLEYKVLAVIEFTSARKCMSILVRDSKDQIGLFCKGAETAVLERLAGTEIGAPDTAATLGQLEGCAKQGLRTLCFAYRELAKGELDDWLKIWHAAQIEAAAALIECDLVLLGATAVEDRLQDEVPRTIRTLLQAGLKIWMLTGDRQETAINIGYSCNLLTFETELLVLNEADYQSTAARLDLLRRQLKALPRPEAEAEANALVIDGNTLNFVLEDTLGPFFLEIARQCRTVICCRVSPLQKSLVVQLVKNRQKAITLAIGDGANDIGMIQAANIGVGITGEEGMQASRASDYSIAQFRFLARLLLVHGAWSYQRLSKLIVFSFYKNIILVFCQFLYIPLNLYSGQTLFESWMISLYNVVFTVWPPIIMGVTDKLISETELLKHPELYSIGLTNILFDGKTFWLSALNAVFHSTIIFGGVMAACRDDLTLANGTQAGLWFTGSAIFATVLATVLLKALLLTNNWTPLLFATIPGSFALWWVYIFGYGEFAPMIGLSPQLFGLPKPLLQSSVFWLLLLLLPMAALSRDYVWKLYMSA